MNNIEIMFIRACRAKNPKKRLISTYNRFYNKGVTESNKPHYIAGILLDICEKYNLISLSKFVSELGKITNLENESKYSTKVFYTLFSEIRWIHPDKLMKLGWKPGKKFRDKS